MFAFLLSVAISFTPEDAQYAYDKAKEFTESCVPRDAGTIRGRIASNWILDEASAAGADVHRDVFSAKTPNGTRQFVNLYAPFRSHASTNGWVVLISHYDTKPGVKSPSANDGASTSAMLISFSNILSGRSAGAGNVLMVWTDAEECQNEYGTDDGLQGAKRAVEWIAAKGYPIRAVICLDMLGDRDLHISIPANGTKTLAKIAMIAAKRAGYPNLTTMIRECVTDDHVPFLSAGHPAIDLIDFDYGPSNGWWHTPEDTMDKISKESLLKSGKLVAEMLTILL